MPCPNCGSQESTPHLEWDGTGYREAESRCNTCGATVPTEPVAAPEADEAPAKKGRGGKKTEEPAADESTAESETKAEE